MTPQASLKVGDTIIFRIDEYRDGRINEFDGSVQLIEDDGVDVIYLSGFRSRNDRIPWSDVIAKVDESKPITRLKNAPFSGHFEVFEVNP